MNKSHILLLFFMFLFLTSCYKNPEIIKIEKIKIAGFVNDTMELDIYSIIDNPNNSDIKLSGVKISFGYEGKSIGEGVVDSDILLEKNSYNEIKVRSFLDLKELSDMFSNISIIDSFPITTNIKATFSSFKFPINKKGITTYIHTKDILNGLMSEDNIGKNISVKSVKVLKSNIDSTYIDLVLEFSNRMILDYTITKVRADIYNNKQKQVLLGTSYNTTTIEVDKNSFENILVRTKLNNIKSAMTLFSKLVRMDNRFFLSGIVDLKIGKYDFSIPFTKEIRINAPI